MEKLIKFITFEEFKKLYSKTKDRHTKLAEILGFGSGLRLSEVVGFRKALSRCCKVEVIKKREGKKKHCFCSECNNQLKLSDIIRSKTEWDIPPLMPGNINLISHQIKILGKGNKERITVASPALKEEHLKLLPITIPRRTLQYRIQALSEKHLGKKISFHTLRHGFGNFMVNEKNLPLPMVQGMLGHSRLDTTGIYTKANPKQAIDKAWESF